MVTIFNRKELFSTFQIQEQDKIKDILSQNNIEYTTKVTNRRGPSPFSAGSRLETGSFGENQQLAYEYTIFVKKTDYERAISFIE